MSEWDPGLGPKALFHHRDPRRWRSQWLRGQVLEPSSPALEPSFPHPTCGAHLHLSSGLLCDDRDSACLVHTSAHECWLLLFHENDLYKN